MERIRTPETTYSHLTQPYAVSHAGHTVHNFKNIYPCYGAPAVFPVNFKNNSTFFHFYHINLRKNKFLSSTSAEYNIKFVLK